MSLSDVTARIAVIQAQIASGAPSVPVPAPLAGSAGGATSTAGSSGANAADFATTLGLAQASIDPTTTGSLDPTVAAALDPTAAAVDPTAASALSAGGATGADVAAAALRFVGVPYVAGGRSPATGWDCAGFTQYVARSVGIDIPDVSWEQIRTGTPVTSLADAQPGDLLFFHEPGGHLRDPSPLKVNHVAVYLGGGQMVEAANPAAGTRVSPVDSAHLVGIRRIAGAAPAAGLGVASSWLSPAALSPAALSPVASTGAAGPGGPALSPLQLVDVLRRAGFSGDGLRTAWAVAMRESSGTPGAVGSVNPNGTRDHGLFQINDIHLGTLIDPSQVYDASANAAAAYTLSKGGTDWSAWGLGGTGWALHLAQTAPDVYRQFSERFQYWYARYPSV